MKTCIIDIETTDLDPKKGRILCIGMRIKKEYIVFFKKNEEEMIRDVIDFVKLNRVGEFVGYNINFDMQYIFIKCLKYGIKAKHFFSIPCVDIMQIMKSVKRIYTFSKPGKLSEWTEYLFDRKKHVFHEKEGEKWTMENIPPAWREAYLFFQGKQKEFYELYHQRSNIESVFSSWKRTIGSKMMMKNEVAQLNEVLCMALCYNIMILVREIFLNNVKLNFNDSKQIFHNLSNNLPN